MWLFTEFGYLLPTITTETDPMRKHEDWDHYSVDGKFTFQVRARLKEHLDYYLEHSGSFWMLWPSSRHASAKLRVFIDHMSARLFPAPRVEPAGDVLPTGIRARSR